MLIAMNRSPVMIEIYHAIFLDLHQHYGLHPSRNYSISTDNESEVAFNATRFS